MHQTNLLPTITIIASSLLPTHAGIVEFCRQAEW